MKIAILNLPFDNNYGGNLQRYALIKTLERQGHEVIHIDLLEYYWLKWYIKPYSYFKRFLQKITRKHPTPVFLEEIMNKSSIEKSVEAREFYEKYIKHTQTVRKKKEIKKVFDSSFDAIIVGSDQVWRESMTKQIGIDSYFLSFVRSNNTKRIAYAVSMGSEKESFTPDRLVKLGVLYSKFDAVSVREKYTLDLLNKYGWTSPKAQFVLDPTLLLDASDYNKLIDAKGITKTDRDYIFCYILDKPDGFDEWINKKSEELNTDYIIQTLNDKSTIEEWLASIMNAILVVTDSYHGCVFSILFKRPFIFLGNERRGNARIESLFSVLGIDKNNTETIDYQEVDLKLLKMRQFSLQFLINNLN